MELCWLKWRSLSSAFLLQQNYKLVYYWNFLYAKQRVALNFRRFCSGNFMLCSFFLILVDGMSNFNVKKIFISYLRLFSGFSMEFKLLPEDCKKNDLFCQNSTMRTEYD